MNFKALIAMSAVAALFAGSANAAPLFSDTTPTGAMASPNQMIYAFDSGATAANLSFELGGYLTLDGNNDVFTDTFTLSVNGINVFSGMFHMGGGGTSQVTLAPAGTSWSTYTTGCSTPTSCASTEIPGQGGHTSVSLPVTLIGGTTNIVFSYAGGAQGLGDEGWGVNSVTVTAVPEPETYAMLIAGLGLLGVAARRRCFATIKS